MHNIDHLWKLFADTSKKFQGRHLPTVTSHWQNKRCNSGSSRTTITCSSPTRFSMTCCELLVAVLRVRKPSSSEFSPTSSVRPHQKKFPGWCVCGRRKGRSWEGLGGRGVFAVPPGHFPSFHVDVIAPLLVLSSFAPVLCR